MPDQIYPSSFVNSLAVRRHSLVAEVRHRMQTRCGWDGKQPLVIGVSGGADSLALLHACHALRQGELSVVHVHHHLREEADADAEHVRIVCEQLHVPMQIEHVYPEREAGNLAAAARRLRYESLQHAAQRVGAAHIAVAHHAEDQLETMLMALSRGAGLDGLSGMAWRRPLGEGLWLLRPLLGSRKGDCESLCRAAGIDWREDVSNVDRAKARSRLRSDVLPVLEELWPGAAARAAVTAELLSAVNDLLETRLQETFGDEAQREWQRHHLRSLPVPVIAAGIRRAANHAFGKVTDDLGQRQLLPAAEAIADAKRRPRVFEICENLRVHVSSRLVRMQTESGA